MIRHTAVGIIERPIEEVFAYVSDVSKQPEWTHMLLACKLKGEGPIGQDSVAIQTTKFMGKTQDVELHVVEFKTNRRIRFRKHEPFHISFGFELEPTEGGTQVVYPVEMEPSGLFRLIIPFIARKQIEKDLANIQARIEARADAN